MGSDRGLGLWGLVRKIGVESRVEVAVGVRGNARLRVGDKGRVSGSFRDRGSARGRGRGSRNRVGGEVFLLLALLFPFLRISRGKVLVDLMD